MGREPAHLASRRSDRLSARRQRCRLSCRILLDFFELAFIIVPLLAAPAETLGIDLIWFGVLLGINMQTSFSTRLRLRALLPALGRSARTLPRR